jgi:hypothetical protein
LNDRPETERVAEIRLSLKQLNENIPTILDLKISGLYNYSSEYLKLKDVWYDKNDLKVNDAGQKKCGQMSSEEDRKQM